MFSSTGPIVFNIASSCKCLGNVTLQVFITSSTFQCKEHYLCRILGFHGGMFESSTLSVLCNFQMLIRTYLSVEYQQS